MAIPEFTVRRRYLAERLAESGLDALIVSALPNVRYLSGFTGSNALLLIHEGEAILATDPRYGIQAGQQSGCRTLVKRGSLIRAIAPLILKLKPRTVGVEATRMSVAAFEAFREELQPGIQLRSTTGMVEELRAVKSPAEIDQITKAVKLCSDAFASLVPMIRPGVREFELAAELDYQMRKLGADGPSFETIVASGKRSAIPHASPSPKTISHSELLLIDVGAQLNGYSSDMTRMVHVGKPGRRIRELYRAVLEAQGAALDVVRENVAASRVDRAARQVLNAHGLVHRFAHSTGHGLGLEIHEPPRLGQGDKTRLKPGMALTIEPGVYIEGFGGVRVEDTIVVTPKGYEILTPTSRDLLVV